MAVGLAAVFFWVPTDAVQGVAQRIFYVHVPTAWVAYLAFGLVVAGSVGYLKSGSGRWDALARASAEVGVLFTGLNLLTGMLWGRPVWGTYWTWDARLTSTFVLFLVYVGYLVFRSLATDPTRGARIAAVIGVVGFVDVPLVHFSVDWWRTLHPVEVVKFGGASQLPASMLVTMLWMVAVFTGLFAVLVALRMRLDAAEEALAGAEEAAEAGARATPAPRAAVLAGLGEEEGKRR
jgi:heme exporter protein C